MSKIDDVILAALEEEDKALHDQLNSDLNLFETATSVFHGRSRRRSLLVSAVILVLVVLAVICGIRFQRTEITSELVFWAAGFGFSVLGASMLKLWLWLEIQKNAILREVKRVELQVARLHQAVDDGAAPQAR
jgi:hypothetical protein